MNQSTMGWLALSALIALIAAPVSAATYYISPTGNDANAGTSALPWKTWAKALGPSTQCGDTLIVMDGVYTRAQSGAFALTKNCPQAQPYMVKAQNERRPLIDWDGAGVAVRVSAGAYITIEGLRVKSIDNASGSVGSNVTIENSNHVTLRRLLVSHDNRYFNNHLIQLTNSPYSLVEECELYFFHRHGVIINNTNNATLRRNYCNSRNHADIPGGYPAAGTFTGYPDTGDDCFLAYPGSFNTFENNITDGGLGKSFALESLTADTVGNKFLGNVSLGATIGVALDIRKTPDGRINYPRETLIENMVVVGASDSGIRARGVKNGQCRQCTVLASRDGIRAEIVPTIVGDGQYSFYSTNSLVSGNGQGVGFIVAREIPAWKIEHPNAWVNLTNYSPASDSRLVSPQSVDPALGACKVWIPDSSPMKRAGLGGKDIGANVLYRYQDGVLTNQPLWDPTTGKFPCGVIVPGVNDVAGNSCRDVHLRLNVKANGCAFPAGYGGSTPPPTFSFSLSNGGAKSVTRGASITNTITATLVSGTAQSTAFSVAGLPSGVTASFSATSCSPTCSTALTLNASALATVGVSTLTVTAVGGGISRTTSFGLTVSAPPPAGSGPIAHWRLDENTGTTAADAAGGDNNGTLTNGPLWTTGRIGSALSFDGINDSVSVPDSPSLDLTGALTLSAWVNPAIATTSYKSIMIKNYTYFMYASAPGCGNGGILAGLSGTPARVVCDTTPLAVNTWTHLAVTYDGAAVRLYRNGVLKSSAAVTGGPAVTAGTLQLGASQYGEHFKGKLDEARVYNRALSAAEVTALFNTTTSGIVTDLNGDGVTNVTDVQMAINQASGAVACSSGDVNSDGACNVTDVQLVINRALGQ